MRRPENIAPVTAITSLQNERVKLIRSLEMRKARRETGLFVAEGAALLITARQAGWVPKMLAFLAGSAERGPAHDLVAWARHRGCECLEVSEAVLGKLSTKDNPQTILGVFEQRWGEGPQPRGLAPRALWIALEAVRDPGNLGTIVRTADAVGADGLMLVGNTVDPFSHEAVRASMGSIFNVPVTRAEPEAFAKAAQAWPGAVIGTHLSADKDFRQVSYDRPVLLVMGSEGPGLSEAAKSVCNELVKIPMAGTLDSLNLSVATALLLYEARRDRLELRQSLID